jgi:hypothetical protein
LTGRAVQRTVNLMSTDLIAFASIPLDKFPFVIDFITVPGGLIVCTLTVNEPGATLVPPLADTYGPVRARITFADGEVQE